MSEVETTTTADATSVEALRRQLAERDERIRDLQHEAKDHRLKAKRYRDKVEELEARKPPEPSAELEALRRENRGLKHRSVFERVARESGVKTTGKALDTLWDAIKYEADGDADPAELGKRIEAARPDYDFLFEPAEAAKSDTPADDLNRAMREQFTKPSTPAKPPGPGVGRGAPADGAGKVIVRKSDLQSFDPRINPMLDRDKAARLEQAKRDGTIQYLDE